MKLHVSVAALVAAAGTFSYGAVARAQGAPIIVAPASTADGVVLVQDENLVVNPGVTISNVNSSGTIDAVNLTGTGYDGQRTIEVNGQILNVGNFTARAIGGASFGGTTVSADPSNDNVTINVGTTGVISSTQVSARSIILDDNITVNNSGSISAGHRAIDVKNNLNVTNNASATIISNTVDAIFVNDTESTITTITNSGTIAGGSFDNDAIYVRTSSSSDKTATLTIVNNGDLTGGGGGIELYSGTANLTLNGGVLQDAGVGQALSSGSIGFSGNIRQTNANRDQDAIFVGGEYDATASIHVGNSGAVTAAGSGSAIEVRGGSSANLNLINEGAISSTGEYSGAAVNVVAKGTVVASISNLAGGSITTNSDAAVRVSVSGGIVQMAGGVGQTVAQPISVYNNDFMATYDPGLDPIQKAPGVITIDAPQGSVINNGVYNGEATTEAIAGEVAIYAPSTHAIRLTGTTGQDYGHIVNNAGRIEAQRDSRNGSAFAARAIYMQVEDEGQDFNLTVNNLESGSIQSRSDVISAASGPIINGEYSAVSSNIVVSNSGSISSAFGRMIFNQNQLSNSATISVTNEATGSISTFGALVRSVVNSNSGTVNLSVSNYGEMANRQSQTDGFALVGQNVEFDLYNGASGTITAQGDVLSARAFGQSVEANIYVGADTGFINNGTIRSVAGSVLKLTEDGDAEPGAANVTANVTNGATGEMYALDSVIDIDAAYAQLTLNNSGTLRSTNAPVVNVNADSAGLIDVTNSGGIYGEFAEAISLQIGSQGEVATSISIDNTGAITSDGNSNAIDIGLSGYGYSSAEITNSGSGIIRSLGSTAVDIYAETADNLSVTNSGTAEIRGANGGYAGVSIRLDKGNTVTVANSGSGTINGAVVGVGISSFASEYSRVDTVSVSNADEGYIYGQNAGVSVSGRYFGSIEVTNSGNAVIASYGRGQATGPENLGSAERRTGAATVAISVDAYAESISISNEDAASIIGEYNTAVSVFAGSARTIEVTNAADATISGNGRGVSVQASKGVYDLTITNSGTVNAYGGGSGLVPFIIGPVYNGGIVAYARQVTNLAVENAGSVSAESGYGIMVSANAENRFMRIPDRSIGSGLRQQPKVVVENTGSIMSLETGIQVVAGEYTNVEITNTSDITSERGNGIAVARSSGSFWFPENEVQIGQGEELASDVMEEAVTRTISITNSGDIVAAAAGVLVTPYVAEYFLGFGRSGYLTDVSVANSGSITGQIGIGIAETRLGSVSVINDGDIIGNTGEGFGRKGLFPTGAGIVVGAYGSYGPISVENNGSVSSDGRYGIGVFAKVAAEDHTITIDNTGDVTTLDGTALSVDVYYGGFLRPGALDTVAVSVPDYATISSVTINNTGTLSGGENGVDVNISAAVTNAGDITAVSEGSSGISLGGGSVTNSGLISGAAYGVATFGKSRRITIDLAAGPSAEYSALAALSIENTGTITGGDTGILTIGDFADSVVNDGGTISGATAALSLDLGDDSVTAKGAAVFSGNVDGGGGTDDLTLDGFTGPSFTPVSFETVDALNGTNLVLDDVTTFGGGILTIDASSTIDASNANNGLTFTSVANAGRLNLQDGGTGDRLRISGNLSSTGTIAVDVDPRAGTEDRVVAGGTATASGALDVALLSTPIADSEHVVVRAAGGATDGGLVLNTPSTVVTSFDLRNDANDIVLVISSDFAPVGLLNDGSAFGQYLNANAGDPALEPILSLAGQAASVEELQALFSGLNGIELSQFVNSAVVGGGTFGNGLFSCAVGEGEFAAIDEGQCGYTRINGSYFERDASATNPGIDETTFSLSAGGQFIYDENIRLGAGLGVDIVDTDGSFGLEADSTRLRAGVSAKYVEGPMMVGVSLSGGVSFNDSERTTALGNADGDFNTYDFSVLARAAYLADLGNGVYVKPQIQGGVTHVERDGFTETGAGAANLKVSSESQTFFSVSPSIELGTEIEADGMKIRPYARVGATILSEDNIQTTARLAGAAAAGTFTTVTSTDNVFGDVAVGATLFTEGDITVRAEYNGRFSDDTMEHGGFVKLQMKF